MTLLRRLFPCALAALAAAFGTAVAGAQAATATGPRITARPTHVRVSSATVLTGAGFPANAVLHLRECGRVFWLVPEEPCNTSNALTVETNRNGRFRTTFHVELCPDGAAGKHATERACYIGRLQFGEDTGEVQPAARITVTYP